MTEAIIDQSNQQPPQSNKPNGQSIKPSKQTNQPIRQTAKQSSLIRSAFLVLSSALLLPIIFVIAFILSPAVQNAVIFMHPISFPPPFLVDYTIPMTSQLDNWVPALQCASYIKTDGKSYNLSINQSIEPVQLGGWYMRPEIRCQPKGSGPDQWVDKQADRCLLTKPFEHNILYLHGNGGNRAFFKSYPRYQLLTRWPFCADVFVFDYRGFGENSGVPTQDSVIADVVEMYNYVVNTYNLTSLDVYGHSLGSALATHALERLVNQTDVPFVTRHLVLEGAIANMIDPVLDHLPEPFASNQWIRTFIESRLDTKLESFSALASIASKIPTVLVHGKLDTKIDISNSQRLWQVLVNSTNEKADSMRFQGGVIHSAKPHAFAEVDAGDHSSSVHNSLLGRVTVSRFLYEQN